MKNKIAQVTGFAHLTKDTITETIIDRIERHLPAGTTLETPDLDALINEAAEKVNSEGQMSIVNLVRMITAPAPEKVLKIKSSPKGARIKVAAANGVRFSFGPIWNLSVSKGKGIALALPNREKLNHQAIMAGISFPEAMEVQALAATIAATFE